MNNTPIIGLRVMQQAYEDENGELVYTSHTIQWRKKGGEWADIEVQLNVGDAPEPRLVIKENTTKGE